MLCCRQHAKLETFHRCFNKVWWHHLFFLLISKMVKYWAWWALICYMKVFLLTPGHCILGRNMVEFKFLGFFFSPVSLSLESHLQCYPGDAIRSCLFPGCKCPQNTPRKVLCWWNIYFHVGWKFRRFRPHQENWRRAVEDCSERLQFANCIAEALKLITWTLIVAKTVEEGEKDMRKKEP
jgi:hypothetical protein